MKAIKFFSCFVIAVLFSSCGLSSLTSKTDSLSYNDSIIGEQTKIAKCMIAMTNNFEANPAEAEKAREEGLKQSDASLQALEKLGSYDGDDALRVAAVDLFKFYRESFNTEFKEIISILRKDSVTELDMNRMNEINAVISGKENRLDSLFGIAQSNFAKKNGFQMKENEIQKEIDNMGGENK